MKLQIYPQLMLPFLPLADHQEIFLLIIGKRKEQKRLKANGIDLLNYFMVSDWHFCWIYEWHVWNRGWLRKDSPDLCFRIAFA